MRLTHLRNATLLLEFAGLCILVDPMLSPPSSLPGFRLFGGQRRKNPLVPLPDNWESHLSKTTHVLISHEHPDHLDRPAIDWIRSHQLKVWSSSMDAPNLRRKGLDCSAIESRQDGLGVECIQGTHGHGWIGWLMGPVSGFYFTHPDEPSIYLTGDTVMTDTIRSAVRRLQPDVVVAPAGVANFGFGRDLLFSVDELIELVKLAPGTVVLNHLESIDHCLITRESIRAEMNAAGVGNRVIVPQDGEQFAMERTSATVDAGPFEAAKPGFQKWLTSWFAGT